MCPIYEYKCTRCGEELEVTLPIADRDRLSFSPCPQCEGRSLVRIVSASNFKVKGANASNGYSTNVADIEKRLGRPIQHGDLDE